MTSESAVTVPNLTRHTYQTRVQQWCLFESHTISVHTVSKWPLPCANRTLCYSCRHVEAQVSGTHSPQPPTPQENGQITMIPLNAMTGSWDAEAAASSVAGPSDAAASSHNQLPCFVLLDDAWRGTSNLQEMFESMQRILYGVSLPQVCQVFLPFCSASKGFRDKIVLLNI